MPRTRKPKATPAPIAPHIEVEPLVCTSCKQEVGFLRNGLCKACDTPPPAPEPTPEPQAEEAPAPKRTRTRKSKAVTPEATTEVPEVPQDTPEVPQDTPEVPPAPQEEVVDITPEVMAFVERAEALATEAEALQATPLPEDAPQVEVVPEADTPASPALVATEVPREDTPFSDIRAEYLRVLVGQGEAAILESMGKGLVKVIILGDKVQRDQAPSQARKLTPEEAEVIRARYHNEKISCEKLGAEYGVHRMTINKLVRGLTYTGK